MTRGPFHRDPNFNKVNLERVRQHAFSDEIVKGQYWRNEKGCAVGGTIHSGDHLTPSRVNPEFRSRRVRGRWSDVAECRCDRR